MYHILAEHEKLWLNCNVYMRTQCTFHFRMPFSRMDTFNVLQPKLNYYYYYYSLNENKVFDGYKNKIKMSIIKCIIKIKK